VAERRQNNTEAYTTYGVKVIVSPDVPNRGRVRPLRMHDATGPILTAAAAAVAARHIVGHFLPPRHRGTLGQAPPTAYGRG